MQYENNLKCKFVFFSVKQDLVHLEKKERAGGGGGLGGRLLSGQYGSFQFQRNIRPNTFIWQS